MQYLMTWMGKTSGSHLGRDDGYPEQKHMVIDSLDSLVKNYRADADYFKMVPTNVIGLVQAAKELSD